MRIQSMDAQAAYTFLVQQATLIEPTVYETVYADLQYASLIPVDTSAPEWIKTITYMSVDGVGQAQWFHGNAHDVPRVETTRDKGESTVHMAAIGYGYNLEEIQTAAMMGMNLEDSKARMARRAAEEFIDRWAFIGDTAKGATGLINNAGVTATTAPADGTGTATTFASKTPDLILRDVNAVLTGMFTNSLGTQIADTLLMPYSVMMDLAQRRIDPTMSMTIFEWLMQNNIYTITTGQRLTVRGVFSYLDTAGATNTKRMVAYRRSPEVLKFHMPMPFRFWPVWQTGPLRFDVPGTFRVGPVDVRLPSAVRYLDGI